VTIWLGLFAPGGTPEAIVGKLRDEVQKALKEPELAERLNVTGRLEPLITTPEEFAALIRKDYERYGALVKEIGIKLE
jgi:tripartite-type tricarboxylate transporter receptor subunit TctC